MLVDYRGKPFAKHTVLLCESPGLSEILGMNFEKRELVRIAEKRVQDLRQSCGVSLFGKAEGETIKFRHYSTFTKR